MDFTIRLLLISAITLVSVAVVNAETCTNIAECTQTKCGDNQKLLCVEPITTCMCFSVTTTGYYGTQCMDTTDCTCKSGYTAECQNKVCHCKT